MASSLKFYVVQGRDGTGSAILAGLGCVTGQRVSVYRSVVSTQ